MSRYHALLVDDEALALSGLLQGVRWKELGIVQVHTADSMDQALEVLSRFPIHLMVSDIEMPGGSGLELILKANNLYPDVISIFIQLTRIFHTVRRQSNWEL